MKQKFIQFCLAQLLSLLGGEKHNTDTRNPVMLACVTL